MLPIGPLMIEEHRQGRMAVADLVEAKVRYLRGDPEALPFMLNRMQFLVDFYPEHIEKEDRHFFLPIMNYFSEAEKEVMLAEEYEFDKNLIHRIYTEKIHQIKKTETSGKPALAL